MIELAKPDLNGNEAAYVADCMATGWVSSIGPYITRFEEAFAHIAGTRHAIATNNGTTALHLALVALGVGAGDEVIVPTATYVATANAVTYCGATVVLVDVEPRTLNLSLDAVKAAVTERTKVVIAVHLYGVPAAVAELRAWCDEIGILLLEDAAEAHGALINDAPVGSFGHAAIFSFFGNKIITTGEGGMVTTDDDAVAALARQLRGQGMDPAHRYWFPMVGFNYRMTNVQAAIGVAQTERFAELVSHRADLRDQYDAHLLQFGDLLEITAPPAGTAPVAWLYNVYVRDTDAARRDAIMRHLFSAGVDSRPVFYPMHQLPPYRSTRPFPVADEWCARGISLPLHTGLRPDDVTTVSRALIEAIRAS